MSKFHTAPPPPPHNVFSELDSLVLNREEVSSILKSLPIGKAVGPDGVSNKILKELAEKIDEPLSCHFNQSLSQGHVPDGWKKSHVSPIPKLTTLLYPRSTDQYPY